MSLPSPCPLTDFAKLHAGAQTYPASTLYMVATPIGNLADLSLRAIHVLNLADAIACEDTRHTGNLLKACGIAYGAQKPLLAAHEHNEREAGAALVARLAQGQRVAYVSDAGTPALSDPGCWLAEAAHAAGHRVMPIAGPSAALAALSASGADARQGFEFAGFFATQAQALATQVQALAQIARPQVWFEAPHRIAKTAQALSQLGLQTITVCRELSKQFEGVHNMPASDFAAWLAQDAMRSKGEFALVIHPPRLAAAVDDSAQIDKLLRTLLPHTPLKTAVALTVELSAAAKNAVYARAVLLKAEFEAI